MHKIIDIYKMYLSPLHMFQQTSCHLQGVFSTELQEHFTSKYTVWLLTMGTEFVFCEVEANSRI